MFIYVFFYVSYFFIFVLVKTFIFCSILSMKKSLKLGEILVSCTLCEKEFKVNTLGRGRLKRYCSDLCKTKAYRLRSGQLGKKFQKYFLGGERPKRERIKKLSEYACKVVKPREKRASFIKRRRDVDFVGYLSLVKRYNKLFKAYEADRSLFDRSDFNACYGMLKDTKVETYVSEINRELELFEKKLRRR